MVWSEEIEAFVEAHIGDDVRRLALSKGELQGEELRSALMQIELRKRMMGKLPRVAATRRIWFGSRLATEQCSSELCAAYKKKIVAVRCKNGVDLTGGMGIDTLFLAEMCDEMTYVERDFDLCEAARHNFSLLATNVKVVNMGAEEWLEGCGGETEHAPSVQGGAEYAPSVQDRFGFGFIDPARRGVNGEKVFRLEDCTPDVLALRERLLQCCERVIVKLSPMLDVKECIAGLKPRQVVIVSVDNGCKELIAVMDGSEAECEVTAVELRKDSEIAMSFKYSEEEQMPLCFAESIEEGMMLCEPWAAMMKSGAWRVMGERYGVRMLAGNSHLYVGEAHDCEFPGRKFRIVEVREFCKREAARMLAGKANIAVRNFPMTVADLRKRYKTSDGGDRYIFLTTDCRGRKLIIEGKKP